MCAKTDYLLSLCSMLNSFEFDRLCHYVLKKINFDLLLYPGFGVYLRANLRFYLAACADDFNFICNMAIFRKRVKILPAHPRGSGPGLQAKIPFDMFHIECSTACMQNFCKNIDYFPSNCETFILDL